MKLRRLLLIVFVIFAIVPVCLVSILAVNGANARSSSMARDTLTLVSQMEVRRLDDFFNRTITEAQLLAGTALLADTLNAYNAAPAPASSATPAPELAPAAQAASDAPVPDDDTARRLEETRRTLLQWAVRLPEVQRAVLCSTDLSVVASSETVVSQKRWALAPEYQERLAGGLTIVTALTGTTDGGPKIFVVAAPVYDSDQIIGYLMLELGNAYFEQSVQGFHMLETGTATLLDSAGRVVASGNAFSGNTLSEMYGKSTLSRQMVSDEVFSFTLDRKRYLGYYMQIENAGWRLLCTVCKTDFAIPGSTVFWIAGLTASVLAALVFALYRLLTIFFTRPMAVLEHHICEIDAGNYESSVPHLGKTEFGEISTAFNKMLRRIQRDRSELAIKEERHRIINEQSNSIIFEHNVETGEVTTSPGGRVLAGFPKSMLHFPESLIEAGNVFLEEISLLDHLFRAMEHGQKSSAMELRLKLQTGDWHWFSLLMTTIADVETHKPLRVVGKLVDIDEQKRKAEALTLKATRDPLTELYNKAATQARILERLAQREQDKLDALMVVDIDHFKRVNDGYGHQKGDAILQQIARVMQRQFRPVDVVGRIGGDEFMILLCDMPDMASVCLKVRMLLEDVRTVVLDGDTGETMSISAGIAQCPRDACDFETLYACADSAAYVAKHAGRDTYHVYEKGMQSP